MVTALASVCHGLYTLLPVSSNRLGLELLSSGGRLQASNGVLSFLEGGMVSLQEATEAAKKKQVHLDLNRKGSGGWQVLSPPLAPLS